MLTLRLPFQKNESLAVYLTGSSVMLAQHKEKGWLFRTKQIFCQNVYFKLWTGLTCMQLCILTPFLDASLLFINDKTSVMFVCTLLFFHAPANFNIMTIS